MVDKRGSYFFIDFDPASLAEVLPEYVSKSWAAVNHLLLIELTQTLSPEWHMRALLDGQAEALTQKVIETALAGDTAALRLCLDRIAPPRKDAPVSFTLPSMATAKDAATAAAAVLDAVSVGDLTPNEAAQIMGLIETYRRTLETCELEARVAALEVGAA